MFVRPKPKLLRDIGTGQSSAFRAGNIRINLGYEKVIRIPLTEIIKALIGSLSVLFFILGTVSAPTFATGATAVMNPLQEKAMLEQQLQQIENEINADEEKIAAYQKQGKNLKGEISSLNTRVATLNLQIKAISYTLLDLDQQIQNTTQKIVTTEQDIQSNKDSLAILLRDTYRQEDANLLEIFLRNPRLSDFFMELNDLQSTQNNIRVSLQQIVDLHSRLEDQKVQLAVARSDAETVKEYRNKQAQETEVVKKEKNDLLTQTKGQEYLYQKLVREKKQTANQIRNRLFELLGGGELTFEEAYKYAKLASGATGVRSALILAVLDRESALGQNVGKCRYDESTGGGRTVMSPDNVPIFMQITQALSIDPESVFVSCPNSDGTYGGAMGPAQFIPSTWMKYSDQVSKITGHSPASPWKNGDAFVATALFLKDAGAANASLSQERAAAAKYYAGSRWRSYLWTYGEAVISRAEKFQQDIDTITS